MKESIDKCILLLCCCAIIPLQPYSNIHIFAILAAVTLSASCIIWDQPPMFYACASVYSILCLAIPDFLIFSPLVLYDVFGVRTWWHPPLFFLPILLQYPKLSTGIGLMLAALLAVSFHLRRRTMSWKKTRSDFLSLQDSSRELAMVLKEKNRSLLEKQDYEVRLATLKERNRISREIHDNVGHMLSRSLLQVGALFAVNQEETIRQGLGVVKESLSQAMDSIRESVHNLHDESIDLYTQLRIIAKDFTFCPLCLEYEIESELDHKLKYCFLSVVKEALSNIIKHSSATQVSVVLREHPALYQLIVYDNGKTTAPAASDGMGLHSMEERVAAFRGRFYVDRSRGFQIFISIPKEKKSYDCVSGG